MRLQTFTPNEVGLVASLFYRERFAPQRYKVPFPFHNYEPNYRVEHLN